MLTYAGHVARGEYASARAARRELRPQMDAANLVKALVLRRLYRAAYQAAIYELEQRLNLYNQGELEEGQEKHAIFQGVSEAGDAAVRDREDEAGDGAVREREDSRSLSPPRPRTAHTAEGVMLAQEGDGEVMVFADTRPNTGAQFACVAAT